MLKKFQFISLALCCLGLQTTYANTPKQTVESAQEFLSLTLTNANYQPGDLKTLFAEITASNNDRSQISNYGKILDISPMQRCQSNLSYSTEGITVQISHRQTSLKEAVSKLKPELKTVNKVGGINWGVLSDVKQEKNIVNVLFAQDKEFSVIELGSEDMAARVAFAMKFLQHHCDQAAATGF